MDFADLDLATASEAGTWLHLKHDQFGKLFLQKDGSIGSGETDKPCRVLLKGVAAPEVAKVLDRVERLNLAHEARISKAKPAEIDALAEQHQMAFREVTRDLISVAVADWQNIVFGGSALPLTRENALRVLGPRTAFFRQVYDEILERRRFFGSAATD